MWDVEENTYIVVLVGVFNPTIFTPCWYAKNQLIGDREAEKAKTEIIHRDVSNFTFEWANIQVLQERFSANTLEDACENKLRTLVSSTFKILRHTPIYQLGINRIIRFSVKNEEEYNKIGHTLVPKNNIWEQVLTVPQTGGVVVVGKRNDKHKGAIRVKIAPAKAFPLNFTIDINDHYEIAKKEENKIELGLEASNIIEEVWAPSMQQGDQIIDGLRRMLEEKNG